MVVFQFTEEQLSQAVQDLRAFVDASYDCYDDYISILDEDGEEDDIIDVIPELMGWIIHIGTSEMWEKLKESVE